MAPGKPTSFCPFASVSGQEKVQVPLNVEGDSGEGLGAAKAKGMIPKARR